MSSSGRNDEGSGNWQPPPSWVSSRSESSLFDNPADDGWGSEDDGQPTSSAESGSAANSPGNAAHPVRPSASGQASTGSATSAGTDPLAPPRGVQPNYGTDYSTDAYPYASDPTSYPNTAPERDRYGSDATGKSASSYASGGAAEKRKRRPLFQINLGSSRSSSSGSGSSGGPSEAIASGVISVVVALIFGRVGFFHTFIWFFLLIGAVGTFRTLFSKRGSRTVNRVCGGIGVALCIAAAVILLLEPQAGPSAFWLFREWTNFH